MDYDKNDTKSPDSEEHDAQPVPQDDDSDSVAADGPAGADDAKTTSSSEPAGSSEPLSPVVGVVGARLLAGASGVPTDDGGSGTRSSNGAGGPAPAWGQIIIQVPPNLKPRQRRAFLRDEQEKATDAGDLPRIRALNAALKELDLRSDNRASRDGLLRNANRENPYDPNLIEAYEGWSIADILAKYQKSIRFDFGQLGLVGGIALILSIAAAGIGKPITDDVLKAQTKAVTWKLKQRIYGLGYEFTTDANQVLRILADSEGTGPVKTDKWFKKQPLPGEQAWDAEFEADWAEWISTRQPVEGAV